jgi:hypothetical protein
MDWMDTKWMEDDYERWVGFPVDNRDEYERSEDEED